MIDKSKADRITTFNRERFGDGSCCHKCWNIRMEICPENELHLRYALPVFVCPICGNLRCPKASDHTLGCTESNDKGQPGSIYQEPARECLSMIQWKPIDEKPEGPERKVLLWIEEQPDAGWRPYDGPQIGWWKHGPGIFSFGRFEDASHLATHWAEITRPHK